MMSPEKDPNFWKTGRSNLIKKNRPDQTRHIIGRNISICITNFSFKNVSASVFYMFTIASDFLFLLAKVHKFKVIYIFTIKFFNTDNKIFFLKNIK